MKKIFIGLALILAAFTASAQVKSDQVIQKAIDKAVADSQNPKKAAKVGTWIKLSDAYLKAYNNPLANVAGGDKTQVMMLLGGEQPISTEIVTLQGEYFEKNVFANKNLYFNSNGFLAFSEVTKPSYDGDALGEAAAALAKAYEVDAKGQKKEDIGKTLQQIAAYYASDAATAFNLGRIAQSSVLFGKAGAVSMQAPCPSVDSSSVYNAALTAYMVQNYDRAIEYYKKALEIGYASEGNTYAALSECLLQQKDTVAARKVLEEGFAAYPQSDRIITSLIDFYRMVNEDPAKILDLLEEAKVKMPDNPALYYVEGDILVKMNKYDEAVQAYRKSAEINPQYEWGYYGEGVLWFTRAVATQEEANALPFNEYRKYDELIARMGEELKNTIEPFEKCYSLTQNQALKDAVADNLKRIYFALRNESPEYKAAYEKYNAIVSGE